MLPSYNISKPGGDLNGCEQVSAAPIKKERNFPSLDLSQTTTLQTLHQGDHPVLIVQSPKTPTLSRKLKAVSLDSDPPKCALNEDSTRDVFSMPNTPKRQLKQKQSFEENTSKCLLVPAPTFNSNLKHLGSNNSISGSQTLKTLPEVMMLQDFSDNKPEPIRIKAKGLLERRGSNASLTIDLGSNSSISDTKYTADTARLHNIKSISHLNLSTVETDRCLCTSKLNDSYPQSNSAPGAADGGSTECGKDTNGKCRSRCYTFHKKCNCLCNFKCRRKSLSNENLYVPPCSYCQLRTTQKDCSRTCKGCRKAVYPRQPGLDASQLLSEDFKLHLQNVQYLQTAGNTLSIADLKTSCEPLRVPKLHQEFWEVPLNLQEKCLVSGSQNKNRYRGVLPNEHSRVHLTESQNYIHANYIRGPDYTETMYIATQGPMTHTCQDFWEMVWSTRCCCIVMLTGLVEKGRNKCELYFPLGRSDRTNLHEKSFLYVTTLKVQDRFSFGPKNAQMYEEETVAFEEFDEVSYGSYRIKFAGKQDVGDCVMRELELSRTDNSQEGEARKVFHYWYPNWHDHKMANPQQVLQLALHVLELTEKLEPMHKGQRQAPVKADFAEPAQQKVSPVCVSAANKSEIVSKPLKKSCHFKRLHPNLPKLYIAPEPLAAENVPNSKEQHEPPELLVPPVVVHCSAGIGRTGCFLAILNGIKQLRTNYNVDVLAILCTLRLNRGGMVQTAEQYELIHRVLNLYTDTLGAFRSM